MQARYRLLVLLGLGVLCAGCRSGSTGGPASLLPPAAAAGSGSPTGPLLPDPKLTPGDTLDVTAQDLCVPGYSQKVRNVPLAVKRQVYAEYGIRSHRPGDYEVDHLISLELGGSNSLKNLWPQSYRTKPWNAHVKDALEDEMHREICSGQLDLKTAQNEIATDWIAAYKKYFHAAAPGLGGAPTTQGGHHSRGHRASPDETTGGGAAGSASADTQVWVNTRSGKYFLPGSRYYGKTREGQYMSRAQAESQGYTAARGQ